jgi:hypothetical protein
VSVETIIFDPNATINENCPHCHAEWGHFIHCILINRNSAEAKRALSKPTLSDTIDAHGMGITLEHRL